MDKAQAMHLDACLPQNWWEFAVDCTTHVYNCTPIQCHDWKMPFENLKCTKPDVTHLHVFGCGAYVFLPEEVHVNKLNPKSELMTFLGYPQDTKGYLFMREPNNVLFTAVQALFDETLTFLQKTMRMGIMGVHHLCLHHLGDSCPHRHLCLDHRLKTKAKARTLIPWFHLNQPLQGRLLLSWNLMISKSLRHLP